MDAVLQSILDVQGVGAVMVLDPSGRLAGHRGHAVYDRALCEQVAALLIKAIDAIQLQQEDWDSMTATYGDGKLILRRLPGDDGVSHVLAIVADATLNVSFATVSIRVAANKLRAALKNGGSISAISVTLTPLPAAPPPPSASSVATAADSRVSLSNSGLTWSRPSSLGLSRVATADPASAAFLSRTAKELARQLGPMAKVYVEEAVRRVSPDAPFALASGPKLIEDLATCIEDADDRQAFLKAVSKS
jgi:hypothetical protein